MVKLRYLGKRYQNFILDLNERSSAVSNILIVLDGASSSELNAVTSDVSQASNKSVHVTKVIDKPELNLTRLFAEAQNTQEILLFDEADAVFGTRSGVEDTHDRYSEGEMMNFLEAIEKHHGIVILASSQRREIGPSFLAKVNVLILFPPF